MLLKIFKVSLSLYGVMPNMARRDRSIVPIIRGRGSYDGKLGPRYLHSAKSEAAVDLELFISIDPQVRKGKPCITGTRITVFDVLDYLAAGQSVQEIVDDFPQINAEQVRACIAFAAERERRLAS